MSVIVSVALVAELPGVAIIDHDPLPILRARSYLVLVPLAALQFIAIVSPRP